MAFVMSKLLWPLLNPGNVIGALLLAGAVLAAFVRFRRLGLGLVWLSVGLLLICTVLPLRAWLIQPLENRFAANPPLPAVVHGVIVLSGAESPGLTLARGMPQLGSEAERIVEFVRLGLAYPEAKLVFAGGSGSLFGSPMAEADVARDVLKALGFNWQRVIFEDRSRNTWENAVNARRLAEPKADENWILVTSAAHMPRAVGAFRMAGWRVIPYPVDFVTSGTQGFQLRGNLFAGINDWSAAAKEWTGLLAYYMLGQSDSVFPAPE